MSTKVKIETLIDTKLASVSDITAIKHREVLKDDSNNILNNIYATEIIDSDVTQTSFVLLTPGLASFTMSILKQGREVTVSAIVTAISNVFRLGSFTAGELTVMSVGNYYGTGHSITAGAIGVEVRDVVGVTSIYFTDTLLATDSCAFTITYNTDA